MTKYINNFMHYIYHLHFQQIKNHTIHVDIYKVKVSESEVAQSCPTLCDQVDCSLPGSSVHGILSARILEWVAVSFSRGSSRPRDQTWVSRIAGRRFNLWVTREAQNKSKKKKSLQDLVLPGGLPSKY